MGYKEKYSTTGNVAGELSGTSEKIAEALSYIDVYDWFEDGAGGFWRWDGANRKALDNEDAWRIARRALDAANVAFKDEEDD